MRFQITVEIIAHMNDLKLNTAFISARDVVLLSRYT